MRWAEYRRSLLLIVIALAACTQAPVHNQSTWTPSYEQADIYQFITLVQTATGKTFVVDPRVQGTVTVVNDKALNSQQLIELLQITLEASGYAVAESDNIVRIFPADRNAPSGN